MITRSDDDYRIPAPVVHWLITGIAGSIIAIGAYMVAWAVNDAAWKASLLNRIETIERHITKIETKVEGGILPLARERIDALERKLNEHDLRK
jgi:hypothetical protein